jgi:hypothetical protein
MKATYTKAPYTTKMKIVEPDQYVLKIDKGTPFVNALRIGLQTLTSRKSMIGYIEDYTCTDANIDFNFFINQLCLVGVEAEGLKLSFYAENKSYGLMPFGTYNLMLGDKSLDLERYHISKYDLGHLMPGTFIELKGIELIDDYKFGSIERFEWLDLDYNVDHPHDECHKYELRWRSYKNILPDVCAKMIDIFNSYKDLKVFDGDIGAYGELVKDYILDMGHSAYTSREFFSRDVNTKVASEQVYINKAIDMAVSDLGALAKVALK